MLKSLLREFHTLCRNGVLTKRLSKQFTTMEQSKSVEIADCPGTIVIRYPPNCSMSCKVSSVGSLPVNATPRSRIFCALILFQIALYFSCTYHKVLLWLMTMPTVTRLMFIMFSIFIATAKASAGAKSPAAVFGKSPSSLRQPGGKEENQTAGFPNFFSLEADIKRWQWSLP